MKKTVLFIVSVLLALLVHVSAAAAAPDPSISQLEARGFDLADLKEAIATKQRHAKRLLGEGGIVGMGAGIRADGRAVVKIYTESFAASDVPPSLDGVPVEVEVTGRVVAQVDTTARFPRPVPTGVSVGHPDITAGTIGARVTDGTDFFLLSNNHVIANVNNALLGDEIVQPGALDGGLVPADTIATLEDFEPIDFSGGPNTLDAAIARTTTSDLGYATPTDGYGAPAAATTSAGVGLPVKKYGRTTGLTTGTIDAVNVTVDVCYVAFLWICLQEARFVNQIAIVGDAGDFSAGGDSGSLVVTSIGNQPVGLLFAGGGGVTFANQIDLVLSRFGVSVDDGSASGGNEAPAAADDGYPMAEDTTLDEAAPGVLGNDDPVDGDSLTASLVSGPSNAASFTLNTDGSFSYSPAANYNGPDSFVYRASDGNGGSDTATVNLTVDPVNDAPYADAGADQTVTAGDTAQLDGSGSGDIDGDSYSYSWNLSTPSGSSATLDNPSAESPSFVTDVEGDYVATLTVDDGNATDQDSVTVTAVRPNQAPKANNDFYSVDEDAALSMSAPGVLDNDDPMDGDPLTAVLNSGPSHASSFSLNPDGSFDYVPAPDFSGSDNFTYYADDGLATDLALVNIVVNDMNDDPVAVADSYSADAGVPLSVAAPGVLDNDSDVDDATLTAVLVSGPTHAASFVLNADGSFDYTSEPGFDDDDTFTYRASDGRGGEATATVTISVAGSPPPPPSTQFYFSLSNNGSVGGLSVANEDIVAFDGTEFALHFDGSDVGLGGLRIDGFDVISATEILMSFTAAGTVGGVSMEDSDVVKFTATQLGVNTAGSFELYFDGSDVGLTSSGEDVDGVELLSDGTLLVSTNGSLSVPGASGKDEDLLAFAPTSLGSTTAGSWSIYFDGSDVQLSDGGGEDVDAVAVDGSGHIHLSTRGSFFVAGVSGADDDVFAFVPSSLGSSTSGAYAAPLYFDGSAYGLAGNDVFGLDFP